MLTAYGLKDVGRLRSLNEDYFFISEKPIGNLQNLYIVADGMGGHKAGDLASEYTVAMFREAVSKSMQTNPYQIMRGAIQYANSKLIEKAKESDAYAGMGTTFVAVTVDVAKKIAYIMNVGDSRLYRLSGELEQITEDHSLVQQMVNMGQITPDEARKHPDKNIITRAIGVADTVEPDYFDADLEDGDILLLCSDGLTNMMEDTEIEAILKEDTDLRTKTEELILGANRHGGRDNISAVLISWKDNE